MCLMQEKQILLSDTVRIDLANECIWYKDEERRLTRKGFATLRYLIEHAGRLVSKEELLHTLWADVSVGMQYLRSQSARFAEPWRMTQKRRVLSLLSTGEDIGSSGK